MRRESQLREGIDQIGPWTCLRRVILIVDYVARLTPLWPAALSGQLVLDCIRKLAKLPGSGGVHL